MIKKLMLLAMAVGALAAFVAPGVAGAATVKSGGTVIPPGAKFTATANATTTRLEAESEVLGTMECEEFVLNGEVTKNSGGTFEAQGEEGGTTSGCSLEGEAVITITNLVFALLRSSSVGGETGTGTFSASFAAHLPGELTCQFTSNGETGVYHFVNGTDKLVITPTVMTGSGACGQATLQGEITQETRPPNTGQPVTYHT